MNYTLNMIKDYIEGEDISENILEDLENNIQFMQDVINYTNDKNFYNLCSIKLKYNYKFVKFLINKFSTDNLFIIKVTQKFLEQSDNISENEMLEILIILCEYEKNYEDNAANLLKLEALWTTKQVMIETYKFEYPEDEDIIGLGFGIIEDNYRENEIIINYFAKKYINYIFEELGINFERYLHKNYNSIEKIKKQGINTFLIKFINHYDSYLANYLKTHITLLNEAKIKFNYIEKNWRNYNRNLEHNRYYLLIYLVQKYVDEYLNEISFNYREVMYHIGLQLNIEEIIKKYDKLDDYWFLILTKKNPINLKKLNAIDLKHYYKIKTLMLKALKYQPEDEDKFDDYITEEKRRRILIFN